MIKPIGVKEKNSKDLCPACCNCAETTKLGAVDTNVNMPLIKPAKLNGIINLLVSAFILVAMLNTIGIKIATIPVELITDPNKATEIINSTINLVSLFLDCRTSQSPTLNATPVRTKPSPMIKNTATINTLLSLNPAKA